MFLDHPSLEFLYEATARGEARDLGETPRGKKRVSSLKGGAFAGPKLRGTILPEGGNSILVRPDGVSELDIRAAFQTDDGRRIAVSARGLTHFPPEARRLFEKPDNPAWKDVDPSAYYFRLAVTFETEAPEYVWLNRVLAVGVGRFNPADVTHRVYALL